MKFGENDMKAQGYGMVMTSTQADEKSRKEDILKLAEGHILQKAELRGKFQRKHQ